ncbi:hypothetical protein [Shewanella baltica]|uniref:Uncharacterized protein n=1 Tax=Shewanella baltica (strain OS155 / ATCC BAA-1091) TaxID=325240 RepID=A3D4L8_SHEB5|nr:hypothetical protein [Shewanella baltica]ABN61681.1 hypothetical protein Sbal_2185 [Shewanella baltica OS155]
MFKLKALIFGAAAAKGISKVNKPYDYGILLQPVPIMTWKNENGEGKASGFKTPDNQDALQCTSDMLHSINQIELPAYLELEMVPHEYDIKTLVCVGFKMIAHVPTKYEQFESLYTHKPINKPLNSTL